MENKEELEMFAGNGADSCVDVDMARETIKQIVEDENSYFGESFQEAYDKLNKEDQDKISKEDIEDLKKFGKINNDSVGRLQDMREKMLKEKEDELFNKFNKALGGDLSENAKLWQQIKRGFLVGLIFGLPGALFIAVKDNLDLKNMKTEIKGAVKDFLENGDKDKLQENLKVAGESLNKKFGSVIDSVETMKVVVQDKFLTELYSKQEELEKTVLSMEKEVEEYGEKIEELVQDTLEERTEEIEEVEDEEDPEPVEGMKFM